MLVAFTHQLLVLGELVLKPLLPALLLGRISLLLCLDSVSMCQQVSLLFFFFSCPLPEHVSWQVISPPGTWLLWSYQSLLQPFPFCLHPLLTVTFSNCGRDVSSLLLLCGLAALIIEELSSLEQSLVVHQLF